MFTKEDYVSLETAKMLKEKGFDETTAGFYGSKRGLSIGNSLLYNSVIYKINFVNDLHKVQFEDVIAAAPTLYEAQKWLRNTYNIHLCVKCTAYIKRYKGHDYICEIMDLPHHKHEDTLIYNSYEQALDAGIREALKLI